MKNNEVKIGKIASSYINSGSNNRDATRSKGHKDNKSTPPTSQNADQRFKSPRFRAAVRKVLTHLSLEPTFVNFQKYDKRYGAEIPFNWHEFAKNLTKQGFSLNNNKDTGVYFETHTGVEIEMGKCLNSIKELSEFNNRPKE